MTLLLAGLAGAGITLAMAPFDWWLFSLLSPAVLFILLVSLPRGQGLLSAYAYGVCYFGAGAHWVYFSVGQYGAGPFAAVVFCTVLAALLGLLPVLMALFWHVLLRTGRPAVDLWLGLPAAWWLLEWVRSWLFTGTTWLQLGYAHVESALGGWAPVIGVQGLGFVLPALAGGLAWLAMAPGRRRALLSLGLLVAVWGVGLLLLQRDWTRPAGPPLEVALLQGNVAQDDKWRNESVEAQTRRYLAFTEVHWGRRDLVVWPETAIPAWMQTIQAETLVPLLDRAERTGTAVLLGLPSRDPATGAAYNSAIFLDDSLDIYHKQHLLPFGEYVPLRAWLGPLLDVFGAPLGDFTPGPGPVVFDLAGQGLAPFICYEITRAVAVRQVVAEAGVLANLSNDAWFGRSIGPHQHYQMARMRALEFSRPLLRSTNTGITAAVDHRGHELGRLPQFIVDGLVATVVPQTGLTPYARWGNGLLGWPVLLLCILISAWRYTRPRAV